MAQLRVTGLEHSFGPKHILEDIDLQVNAGEVVAIVGPSGGGKTTLLHLCAGLTEAAKGCIDNGFASTACTFQEARLLPWQTALDNIAFGLKAQGVSLTQRRQQAQAMGLRLGLEVDDLSKFPKDLSGGMAQRVAFARALLVAPELLFLDEPFSALDIGLKQELQHLLVEQVEQRQLAMLMITHDLREAVRLSHRILVLGQRVDNEQEPGRLLLRYDLPEALSSRDDAYVYGHTAKLLTNAVVIDAFALLPGAAP